jgi:hypothetical protein
MDVDPMTGEEMQKLIGTFYESPPELIARLMAALEQFRKH